MTPRIGIRWRVILPTMAAVWGSLLTASASGGTRGGMTLVAAENPQGARQRGEIGQQREDEGRRGDYPELAHGGQIGEGEREKAARVDESGEQYGASCNQHGMFQRDAGRVGRAAFLEVIEKVDLVVLRRSQYGRADQDGG